MPATRKSRSTSRGSTASLYAVLIGFVVLAEAFPSAVGAGASVATSGKLKVRRLPAESWELRGARASPDGVVHFLFMVNSSMQHVGLWKRFFAAAPPGKWRAWVHCADSDACHESGLFDAMPD